MILDPSAPRVALLARDIDPRNAEARLALVGDAIAPAAARRRRRGSANRSPMRMRLHGGSLITVPLDGRAVTFTVAGVWRDYVRQQGAIVIERARYVALTGDDTVNEAALWLAPAPRRRRSRRRRALRRRAAHVVAATPGDLRKLSLAAFDRTFAVTYALEAAAVLIGIVGLSATLVAQTLARSREFGMLRHVGMTRGQLGAMLAHRRRDAGRHRRRVGTGARIRRSA